MKRCFSNPQMMTRIIPVCIFLIVCGIHWGAAEDISVTPSGDLTDWVLLPGETNSDTTSIHLEVVADSAPWYVKVKDGLENDKPESSVGYMVEWNGSQYVATPHVLNTGLIIEGSDGPEYSNRTVSALSGSLQEILVGSSSGTFPSIAINFTQPITSSDAHLTNGNVYRIYITFTGGFS